MLSFNRTVSALIIVVAFAAFASALSCSSESQTNPCPGVTEPYTEYRLFFGLGDADDRQSVSDQLWEGFLEDNITAEFPAGLTVLDAKGQYTDPEGNLIEENTKVVIILVPQDDGVSPAIDRLIEKYKLRFREL